MKNNFISILFIGIITSFTALAQGEQTIQELNQTERDVIFTVDGIILQGYVTEVSPTSLKYRAIDKKETGPDIILNRSDVYAINYASGTTDIITPKLMGKRTGNDNEISPDTSWAFIKSQLDRGVLRVGVGFFKNYSSLKGVDDYSIEVSAPGLALAYHTKVSRLFYAGVNLGIASFDYTQEFNSDYDQIYIRQTINEKLFTVGFFGRFDLTETFIRPYLLGGVNFNIAHVETNSELSNNVSVKSVNGYTKQAGVKPDLILRGGLDVRLSRRFGVYSDIGTGLNLFQVGVIFIFD